MKNTGIIKKTMSIGLVLAMLCCMIPAMTFNFATAENGARIAPDSKTADPSTMDNWKYLFTEDSTLNAGGVWADKSVFTDTSAFPESVTMRDPENNLLIALSAIASNKEILGYSTIPTDTMLVLDVSGSMRNSGWDDDLAVAANAAIKELLAINKNNRVGVVLYSGNSNTGTSTYSQSVTLLLPLDRYTPDSSGNFINRTNGGALSVDSAVRTEDGRNPEDISKTVVGGTYIQAGLNEALNQFLESDTVIKGGFQDGKKRLPILVLMSDGNPTIATTNYDDVDKVYTVGSGRNQYTTDRSNISNGANSSESVAFVTQLTASYVLNKIEQHYNCDGEALFYTLSLGEGITSIGKSVLDPSQNSATINGLWDDYFKLRDNATLTITVPGTSSGTKNVSIYRNSDVTVKNYVDKYFPAESENDFLQVFKSIVDEIILQSRYYPTNLEGGSPDFSGYLTFEDTIGEHMEVKEVIGILYNDILFSGERLSDRINTEGMGTIENPTEFGLEFRDSVKTRLGITENSEVFQLIADAYNSKQLIYSEDDPHCYIGWYAGAGGKYLGFWNEGVTTVPEGALYKVKSYGFLGENVGNLKESDMMFMTLRVITNIENGKQTVLWKIPAALVPLITYSVTLDGDRIEGATGVEVKCSTNTPVRLLMEVGLQDNINKYSIHSITDAKHLASDGVTRQFWTNHFDISAPDHTGHITTSLKFTPSLENELYYFTENSVIFELKGDDYVAITDKNYSFDSNTTYYHWGYIFTSHSDVPLYHYSKIYADAFTHRVYSEEKGAWIIPIGTAIVSGENYEVPKTENATGSAGFSLYPYVKKTNASYDAFFNLGNNGLVTLKPVQGIEISKTLDAVEPGSNTDFEFKVILTPPAGTNLNSSYPVMTDEINGTDGEIRNISVVNGVMTIPLSAGQSAYITDLPTGTKYTVTESLHTDYVLKSIHKNGVDMTSAGASGTIAELTLDNLDFVNTIAVEGSLIISKTVTHPFGDNYTVPKDIKFTANVKLTNNHININNQTYELILPNGESSTVTTNANGEFSVTLAHGESVVIHGLPEGTTNYTVTETNIPNGFSLDTAATTGTTGTITSLSAQQASLVNNYIPNGTSVEADISVEKLLSGRDWLENESYSFNIYRFDPLARAATEKVGEITVNAETANKTATVSINDSYTYAGAYQYIITENVGDAGGITYDTAERRFRVIVADEDMDGELEIVSVENMMNTVVTKNGSKYTVSASFTNSYTATEGVSVILPVQKTMTGDFGLNGFAFALYEAGNDEALVTSTLTDVNGNAQFNLYFPAYMAGNTYTYILKEIAPNISGMADNTQEYTVAITVTDNLDGTTSASVTVDGNPLNQNSVPVFNNTYDPVDAQILFSGNKQLTGRVQNENEFSFELYNTNADFAIDGVTPLQTVTNGYTGDFIFQPIIFTADGEYYFVIREVKGDLNGIDYDETLYQITVTVTDNNGVLTATSNLTQNIVFNNSYTPDPVDVVIEGTKILRGRDIVDGEFTFELIDSDGYVISEANNMGTGFKFDAITFDTAGTYTYVIREQKGDLKGVTYDEAEYTVTVYVTDNGNGKLLANTEIKKNGMDSAGIVFTNEYIPAPWSFTLNGNKALTGRALAENEFKFSLENVLNAQLVETVTNNADGSFSFSEITLHSAGEYHYHIIEIGEELPGITYDTTTHHVSITVTDTGGELSGEMLINDSANGEIAFTNIYDAVDASVILKGEKTFTNGTLAQGMFEFNLLENGDVIQTVSHDAEGKFQFEPISFNAEGVYEYTITETQSGKAGVIYDTTVHNAVITVTDVGGVLVAEVTVDGEATDTAAIVNTYDPIDTEITIKGKKFYSGDTLKGDDFSFVLADKDGEILETVKNDANGDFQFTLKYDTVGVYEYTVYEVNDGNKHIVYDNAIRNVKITVTDIDGRLNAECEIDNMAINVVNFTNTFIPNPDDVNTQIKVQKTVNNLGYEEITPEGFKFLLTHKESGITQTIAVDENGVGAFNLTFTKASVGQSFNYTATEINDEREGVVYDNRVYEISYTVELNENNELLVKCFVNGKEVDEPTIEFQNTYEPYIPKPGDNTNMLALVLMLIFSIGVLAKAVPALWDRISRF